MTSVSYAMRENERERERREKRMQKIGKGIQEQA